MTLIVLCIFGVLNMVGAAAYLGGFKSTIKVGFGTLMFMTILATIEVALAFSLALQTGSTVVLVANGSPWSSTSSVS